MSINDTQIILIMIISLIPGHLALKLGKELYL